MSASTTPSTGALSPEATAGRAADKGRALWRSAIAPVAVLLLAAALRFAFLGTHNTWYDEVDSILFAERDLPTVLRATVVDSSPPLYYFVLHFWLGLGNSLWIARSLSVLFSLGAVLLTYGIARRLFSRTVALLAAVLVAISPFQVYHGQEARMYAPLLVAQLAGVHFLVECLQGGRRRAWLGFTLSQAAALYLHNVAFAHLLGLDLYAALALLASVRGHQRWHQLSLLRSDHGRFAQGLVASNAGIAVLAIPWLMALPGQLARVNRAFWTEPPGLAEGLRTAVTFTFGLPAPSPWALPVLLALSLLILALVVQQAARCLREATRAPVATPPTHGNSAGPLLFVLAVTLLPGLIVFAVSQVRPIYVERVLITASATYLILVAWALLQVRPRLVAVAVAVPSLLLIAWSLQFYYGYEQFPRPNFGKLVALLQSEYRPGDAILHDNKLTFFPAHYLDRSLPQGYVADPPWSTNDTLAPQTQEALGLVSLTLPEAVAGKPRVLFVIFQQAIDQAREQGRQQENKAWLDDHLRLVDERRIGDLRLYVYEP